MKIISWNICGLPRNLNFYHNPHKKIDSILETIFKKNPCVLLLQEVFDLNIQKKVLEDLEKNQYHVNVSENLKTISSDGLLTATKQPIFNKDLYKFKHNTSVEFFIEKGIQKTQIENMTIYNTHIQSDSMLGIYSRCKKIRYKQYKETLDFINTKENLIFGGDFNEDYDDIELNNIIQTLKLSHNKNKLVTFPEYSKQLDYILTNINNLNTYEVSTTDLSDHYIIELK